MSDLKNFARFAAGLPEFYRHTLSPVQCRDVIVQRVARRAESFLSVVERGIYAQPRSPYRQLLNHVGIAFDDLREMVRQDGVEGALDKLHAAGVYITLDEFKGRRPVVRGSFRLETTSDDFDNPLLRRHYEGRTGGSRGAGRRVRMDLDLLAHEAAYHQQFLAAFGRLDAPLAVWRPVPLVTTGLVAVLRYTKIGKRVERWFSPTKLEFSRVNWKYLVFTHATLRAGRACGRPLPFPEHVPQAEVGRIVRWMAEKKSAGTPASLNCSASAGTRVCLTALRERIDIAGSFFILGGEPYTPGKAKVVSDAGCHAVCQYSISEIGNIGLACAQPVDLDDVHLLEDKIAAIQRPITVGQITVPALVYTTLLPSCPKLMLNVESDDYATMETRACGCPWDALGFHRHVRQIRSYEKLCSEGVSFLGTELLRLVEEVLPAEFGGSLMDYQFAEEEVDGLTKVNVVVSPARGAMDEGRLLATIFKVLRTYPGGHVMANAWEQGQTLRVVRREPYVTGAAKILPLHILKPRRTQ